MNAYVVKFSTDYDSNFGGSAITFAEDEGEAVLMSEDFCYNKLLEQIGDTFEKFSVDINVKRFDSCEDGCIDKYEVIEF
jgi:cephalosporin hydroxylase